MKVCRSIRIPTLAAMLGTAWLTITASTASAVTVKTGDAAPDFTLPGHDGKTYKLSDFKGKHVVLEWFNNDCPYVKKHYGEPQKNMQGLQKTYAAKDVVWLTIVSSTPGSQGHVTAAEASKILKERDAAPKALLMDPSGDVGRKYDAKTTPHMYVINPEGKLVYQGAIDDKPSAKPESLNGAKPYLVNALDASMSGKPIAETTTTAYGCAVKYKS